MVEQRTSVASAGLASTEPRLFIVADISGYTRFLEAVQESHPEMLVATGGVAPAYGILSTLLDTVMTHISPYFSLVQVEGDALFAWAPESSFAGGCTRLLQLVLSTHQAFRKQIELAMHHQRHDGCTACVMFPFLELKFVVHDGVATPQRVAGRELLAGPAVNLVHRILKNSITDKTGWRAYLFVTDAAANLLGLTEGPATRYTENYPDAVQVPGWLLPLAAT